MHAYTVNGVKIFIDYRSLSNKKSDKLAMVSAPQLKRLIT